MSAVTGSNTVPALLVLVMCAYGCFDSAHELAGYFGFAHKADSSRLDGPLEQMVLTKE